MKTKSNIGLSGSPIPRFIAAAVGAVLFCTLLFISLVMTDSAVSYAGDGGYPPEAPVYVLIIDSEPVAAADSVDALKDILAQVTSAYVTDATSSVGFSEDVFIAEGTAGDLPTGADDICAILEEKLTVITQERVYGYSTIPFVTEYRYDDTMFEDETTETRQGEDGVRRETVCVTYENGRELSRDIIASETVTLPVSEIITAGTMAGSRNDSRGFFIWPAEGVISSYFGHRSISVGSSDHKGIDIAGAYGAEVAAADSGEVIYADWAEGYGRFIKLRHDDGSVTCYAHLSEFLCCAGDRVAQGDVIGLIGSSGISSGAHLHFEVRPDGVTAVNPLDLLPERAA